MEAALFPLQDLFSTDDDEEAERVSDRQPHSTVGDRGQGRDTSTCAPSSSSPAAGSSLSEACTGDGREGEDMSYEERQHQFPGGVALRVREFSFHAHNANLLWPGALAFADWLWIRPHLVTSGRVLELGSGTGALAIFLHKALGCQITTSDYDDAVIEANIAANCRLNGVEPLPHIRHTWGQPFPVEPLCDVIIASDILLYVKQYPNLIKTLKSLLRTDGAGRTSAVGASDGELGHGAGRRKFIMSWRRRIPREEERKFFEGCEANGLCWKDLGSRVYEIIAAE